MSAKILVVEDEGDLRELIIKTLAAAGYETFHCDNGREVLPLTAKHKPSLILLDIMLPGIDGVEIARQLSDDPALSSTPFLAVSALEHSRKQLELMSQCKGFVSKPFAMSDLLGRIKAILRKTR